jgi:hypothetical protein
MRISVSAARLIVSISTPTRLRAGGEKDNQFKMEVPIPATRPRIVRPVLKYGWKCKSSPYLRRLEKMETVMSKYTLTGFWLAVMAAPGAPCGGSAVDERLCGGFL